MAEPLPQPRAHLRGTLRLLAQFSGLAALDDAELGALSAFLDRPGALPERVPPEHNSLKYDCYLRQSAAAIAWGCTINDRWEGTGFRAALTRYVARLEGRYDLERLDQLAALLPRSAPTLTVGLGFDRPGAPPRLKLYLQEDRWGAGVGDGADLRRVAGSLGAEVPSWLPDERRIGVLCLELIADGGARLKAYVGARAALDCAAGAPEAVRELMGALAAASPMQNGFHYLTLRLAAGAPVRYAANKIYDFQDGFGSRELLLASWDDVAGLFERAGQGGELRRLRAGLAELTGIRVVPTASALEEGQRSADVYCAAWELGIP